MPLTPGLLYLAASVACSVTVAVMLKLARRWQVDVRQAIAMNYAVAALLCWLVLRPDPARLLAPQTPWLVLAALGVLLPSVFLAMAAALRHAGIVRSDAAQRLSLFIPLLAAFVLFGEPVTGRKLAAILLAPTAARIPVTFVAVVLALVLTGWGSARLGQAPTRRATVRTVVGGAVAMGVTYAIGSLLDVNV